MSTPESALSKARIKLTNTSGITYSFHSQTHNLFNETHYIDSAQLVYLRLEDSHHGFGFHVSSDHEEYFYNGFDFFKVEHSRKRIVQYDPQEIESDPEYFLRFTFLANNPMLILNDYEFASLRDTVIHDQACFGYKEEVRKKSNADTTEIVMYQKWFFIDTEKSDVVQITDLTIREGDTLQVVDYFFTGYTYGELAFPKIDPKYEMEYIKVSEEDAEEVFTYVPIKEGEKLTKSNYIDVYGQEISLFGQDDKSCLMMFSFIGCAPCESALHDFKSVAYNFNPDIKLYYSSFQNSGETLKRYLKKKGFPNTGFGMESNMIAEFSLYHAPTFVFFDSSGTIRKVMEGYDEEVKANVFKILSIQRD